jgi:hypothetical protein
VPRIIGPCVAAVLATLSMAACASSGGSPGAAGTPAGAAPATATTASPSHAAAPAVAGGGKLIDVCAVLPAAKASQITGGRFTSAEPRSVAGLLAHCEYKGGTDLLQVTVTVQSGPRLLGVDVDALKAVGHPPTTVSGVGDGAFSEPDPAGNAGSVGASSFASYGAVFGQTYIKVGGLTYVNADQGKQIVEILHAAM